MKTIINRTIASLALVLSLGFASAAEAAWIKGRVTFVGTYPELTTNGNQPRFQFRLEDSTCHTNSTPTTRWIIINGGRTEEPYGHNAVTARNAYNTLMTAFLTGHGVQIDGSVNCTTTSAQSLDLWRSYIGIY